MDGLTVRQKDNTQKSILHFGYLYPAPNPTIGLSDFPNRRSDGVFDPFFTNNSAIGTTADRFKITRNLHTTSVADFSFDDSNYRITALFNVPKQLCAPRFYERRNP